MDQAQTPVAPRDYDFTMDKSRLKLWCIKALCSFIVLINVGTVDREDNEENFSNVNKSWGLALAIITFISALSVIGLHFHHLGAFFLATKIEGFTIGLHLLFTVIIVGIVSGPEGLGMDSSNSVHLGNAYYFSWASFGVAVALMSNFINGYLHLDIVQELRERSASFIYWVAIMSTSLVVLGASSDTYNSTCDVDNNAKPQPYCRRTVYGIVMGLAGTLFSLLIIAMKITRGASPFLLEVGLIVLLTLLFTIGTALITDVEGPGAPLGNLYYFSWISLGLVLWVAKSLHEDYKSASGMEIGGMGMTMEEDVVTSPRPTGAVVDQHDDMEEGGVAMTGGERVSTTNPDEADQI